MLIARATAAVPLCDLSSDVSEIRLMFSTPPHRPIPNFALRWKATPTDSLPAARYDRRVGERSFDLLR